MLEAIPLLFYYQIWYIHELSYCCPFVTISTYAAFDIISRVITRILYTENSFRLGYYDIVTQIRKSQIVRNYRLYWRKKTLFYLYPVYKICFGKSLIIKTFKNIK